MAFSTANRKPASGSPNSLDIPRLASAYTAPSLSSCPAAHQNSSSSCLSSGNTPLQGQPHWGTCWHAREDLIIPPQQPHRPKRKRLPLPACCQLCWAWWLIAWPRRTATLLAHGGRSGTSAGWLQSPGRWRTPFTPPPQKGHQRGENGYYRTSIINWTQSFTWGAAGNIMQPPCQWHSGWLPCVGTLPGPLPKMPVTGPGPDQGTGPRQVLATLPKVCGVQSCWWPPCHPGGRLQGRGRGLWQQRRERGRKWAAAVADTVVTLQMILGL